MSASRVADRLRRDLDADLASLPPEARLQRCLQLGDASVAAFAEARGLDLDTAREVLRRNAAAGRPLRSRHE